jgi:hypothetical protein
MSEGMVEAKLIALLVTIEAEQVKKSREIREQQLELIRIELDKLGLGNETKKDPPKDKTPPKDKKDEEKNKDVKKLSQDHLHLDNVLTSREKLNEAIVERKLIELLRAVEIGPARPIIRFQGDNVRDDLMKLGLSLE